MKSLLMLGALFVCAAAISRPLVIENNVALLPYAEDFAFAGDEMLSTHVGFTGESARRRIRLLRRFIPAR
jgi:hypothetical protein